MVQRSMTGPAPLACVKVAVGVVASGLKEPLPPLTMNQLAVPELGGFPPRGPVVPPLQMVCGGPTVAVWPATTTAVVVAKLLLQPLASITVRL